MYTYVCYCLLPIAYCLHARTQYSTVRYGALQYVQCVQCVQYVQFVRYVQYVQNYVLYVQVCKVRTYVRR